MTTLSLEHTPPVLTLQDGRNPLHDLLGFETQRQILCLSARDPHDGRETPANGKDYISAWCVRGVRKVSVSEWRSYVAKCRPDIVTALSDTPYTQAPLSQKRITKSLEKSAAWLADILSSTFSDARPANVLVNMVGGGDERARRVFAEMLVEKLFGKDLEFVQPFQCLDEGLSGYIFDLVPLRFCIPDSKDAQHANVMRDLIKASLEPLPVEKLRVVHSTASPHEMLRLIRDVGIDLFDARWAQEAADLGVALDFRFPVPDSTASDDTCLAPHRASNGQLSLGHNLFHAEYAHDHSRLASTFLDAASARRSTSPPLLPICDCAACSPRSPSTHISHSAMDALTGFADMPPVTMPPFTRSYIHHLLHTHEMSSHSLLIMHNLTVMDAFFAGVRSVLGRPDAAETFAAEVEKFHTTYDDTLAVMKDAHTTWSKVERERGKGRLARDKVEI